MTVEFLTSLIIPIVFVACLIFGYVIKHLMIIDNKYIPLILAVLGAILGCIAVHALSLEAVVGGALSGLASTGAHQLLKQFIENSEPNEFKGEK